MKQKPANFHSVLHSADLLERRLATLLSPLGIRPRQARILNALSNMGEVSQSALADSFGVTAGSVSTMLDRLEKPGLVRRRPSRFDKRIELVSLTRRGATVLDKVWDVWAELDDILVETLGEGRAAQLVELTRELKFALGGKVAASREGVARARAATEREIRAAQRSRPIDSEAKRTK